MWLSEETNFHYVAYWEPGSFILWCISNLADKGVSEPKIFKTESIYKFFLLLYKQYMFILRNLENTKNNEEKIEIVTQVYMYIFKYFTNILKYLYL